MSGRERRFKLQTNHTIAKSIVQVHPHTLIGMEDLTGLREDKPRRKHRRKGKRLLALTRRQRRNHGARWAVCPAMAILNYAYAILEAQVRQALNGLGFDVACGYLHADQLYKDSLVFDVMELHRGGVDHLVLKLLGSTIFNKGDLMSRPTGEVRFNPQIARYISASCQLPQADIDMSAKWIRVAIMGE